jgi:hypothetical protein
MIVSLLICFVSLILLAATLGYRMYSKAEVERELKYVEIIAAAAGKKTIQFFRSIDQKKIEGVYHWFLVKIENMAHAVAAQFRK